MPVRYFSILLFVTIGLLGCSSSGTRAPVSDLTSTQSLNSSPAQKGTFSTARMKTYQVQRGDTLYSIAWRADLDVNTLAKRNNIKAPYLIYQGQTLKLVENKQEKRKYIKKTSVKSNHPSQKIDKNRSAPCTDQSCKKNQSKKVVHQKTKAYSANKADEKAAKSIRNTKKSNSKVTAWRWPAKGKLTKTFYTSQLGMKGISISNQRGSAVYAATAGEVVYAGNALRGYGNLIIIKHNYDYLSAYAHNEKLLVRENQKIKMGQKIAIMGDSATDSVHLHFEIRYRGKSVDPLRYLPKR